MNVPPIVATRPAPPRNRVRNSGVHPGVVIIGVVIMCCAVVSALGTIVQEYRYQRTVQALQAAAEEMDDDPDMSKFSAELDKLVND